MTFLQRFLAAAAAVLIFVAAFAFSVMLFAVIAAVGVVALAIAWWRMKFGKPRPGRTTGRPAGAGDVIDVPSREVERDDDRPPR